MPTGSVANNFNFNGLVVGVTNDPSNTQDQSNVYIAGVSIDTTMASPTSIGEFDALDATAGSVIAPGDTQTVGTVIGIYTETLLGDGVNTATYNITKTVGVSIGTTGFSGPQDGTIGTSWGLNIEGPRLGTGTGTFQTREGIRIASQNQGNPGGRNPNSWAIHEDDPLDRNAFGSINLAEILGH